MAGKPKVAFYWCAGCGGCEEAIVDLAEDLLQVANEVDIVFWPVAMDFKKEDVETFKDGEIAVSFINGAIRTEEHNEMSFLLRKKSRLVVAFGSCAHLGGIPGLANLSDREELFLRLYGRQEGIENPDNVVPKTRVERREGIITLPGVNEEVRALNQIIDVDYYIPGCAPPPNLVKDAIKTILSGELPPEGSILAPDKTLCDECPRRESKPEKIFLKEIKRISLVDVPQDRCFLAEGVFCMGPVTRKGCGERCLGANMPCRGCFGPSSYVTDQGSKFLSAVSSILETDDEEEAARLSSTVLDPAGLFYMFSLPSSLGAVFKDRKNPNILKGSF
ncbi:MAG: oxidoreductase [Spirochaetes bacterium]|nr:MAG: oxidoreductase [Spirochaetota bacterium]